MTPWERYSDAQLAKYFDRVRIPRSSRLFDVSSLDGEEQLRYLSLLIKHQLTSIPFENLTLHYSWHRVIDTDPQHLFEKIVDQPGRGGYCMEANSLFHVVLESLGFDVYMVASRVKVGPDAFTGITHCLNIVTIGDARYTVDVGFGANEPVRPCKMESGLVQDHIGPAQMRLRWGPLSNSGREAAKVWFYEHRPSSEDQWSAMYCFMDYEFLPADVTAANLMPSTSVKSIFRKSIICVRFTTTCETEKLEKSHEPPSFQETPSDTKGEINGVLILVDDNIKWRRDGKKVWEEQLQSESGRLERLEEYFGIQLSKENKESIKGTSTEITGSKVNW